MTKQLTAYFSADFDTVVKPDGVYTHQSGTCGNLSDYVAIIWRNVVLSDASISALDAALLAADPETDEGVQAVVDGFDLLARGRADYVRAVITARQGD